MSVKDDLINLKKMIHKDAIIKFDSEQGLEDVNLDVYDTNGKVYRYCLTNVDVENTLIIDVDKIFNFETSFTGSQKEAQKPDYIIFTRTKYDKPLLAILELKRKPSTCRMSKIAYQILGGVNFSIIIIKYFKFYYNIDLFYFLENIGTFELVSYYEKPTTKIIKLKTKTPIPVEHSHHSICENCQRASARRIDFRTLLSKGNYIDIISNQAI